MNDEIKELLDDLDKNIDLLLDYINNLQQENERLKEANKYLDELRNANYLSWQDSLSRIDKAIEYMKDFIFEPLLVQEDRKLIMYNENLRKFENILNGKSDE